MTDDPIEHVEWFHSKFRHTYHPDAFPEMVHDHRVLCTLIKQYDCRTICEIGTWNGDTALMLWTYPLVKRLKCIDICDGMDVEFTQPNHALRAREEYGKMFANTYVELMFADTMKYDRGGEQHDLVFIDGAHDYEHVKNDTELAVSWKPKIICWHDYNNGNEDVTKWLNELAASGKTFTTFKGSCIAAAAVNL